MSEQIRQTYNAMVETGNRFILGESEVVDRMAIGALAGANMVAAGPSGDGKTHSAEVLLAMTGSTADNTARIHGDVAKTAANLQGGEVRSTDIREDGTKVVSVRDIDGKFHDGVQVVLADEVDKISGEARVAFYDPFEDHTFTKIGGNSKVSMPIAYTMSTMNQAGPYQANEPMADAFGARMHVGLLPLGGDESSAARIVLGEVPDISEIQAKITPADLLDMQAEIAQRGGISTSAAETAGKLAVVISRYGESQFGVIQAPNRIAKKMRPLIRTILAINNEAKDTSPAQYDAVLKAAQMVADTRVAMFTPHGVHLQEASEAFAQELSKVKIPSVH